MSEDEAKTKWCPMYRQAASIDGHNREGADNRGDRSNPCCIASACMAWRWRDKAGTDDAGKAQYYTGPWQGHCGLAGKP